MGTLRSTITWASAALIAVGCMSRPEPVQARGLGGFGAGMIAGAVLGGIAAGRFRGMSRRGHGRGHVRETRGHSGRVKESRDENTTKQIVASLGAPSSDEQIEVLHNINSTEAVPLSR